MGFRCSPGGLNSGLVSVTSVVRKDAGIRVSAEQVRKIRTILEELGYGIASPTEAREALELKGGDRVKF